MLLQLIGERLRYLRKKNNLTQEELAEKAGLNPSYIGSVERGERNISIETLEKLIHGLNVTPTEMFQLHEMDVLSSNLEDAQLLEVVNSLLYSRTLEEKKLIYRIIKDVLETLDSKVQ
ncbi:helix-turn-helix domain-containing protein [Paenibacillus thiaminolyticus]|uniref:helix-turn-helix domain-containing protein n=1 Tax=Paenibacillus thiaminolyticus TaxID=49283 RepID=UPI002330E144|nr:helix-turn-helix transcriptional regulator [Paenibacillus thiaminolyticus]WCF08285.1 helix-turn-helix domain-containing protein [Paenibacillus thiaminolyticus]WII37558.1 helix-turn-helix transcriptional regulator [Paenibacillus thiaminolyticus]